MSRFHKAIIAVILIATGVGLFGPYFINEIIGDRGRAVSLEDCDGKYILTPVTAGSVGGFLYSSPVRGEEDRDIKMRVYGNSEICIPGYKCCYDAARNDKNFYLCTNVPIYNSDNSNIPPIR